MTLNSSNGNNNHKIKVNAKGKLLSTGFGDQGGDPLEKVGWGRRFDNKNLTKCNLKVHPLFFKKGFKLTVHPDYLNNKGVLNECAASNAYLSSRTENNSTDDTFFTGELIKAILEVFMRKDLNFNQKCVLVAMKFHENLKDFAAKNSGMLGECGGNTKDILLGNKEGGPKNQSNRNGCAMRIPLVGIFADSLSKLWKIVLTSIRNTHYHEHSFDSARSVASIVFLARAGLSQKSMAKFINLEFKNKYTSLFKQYDSEQIVVNAEREYKKKTKQNEQIAVNKKRMDNQKQNKKENDKTNREKLGYYNQSYFFNFNMDDCTPQSVYNDRLSYRYTETALDTVVVALRIICVARSFYEACALAKSYGGDSDTLLAIVCAMAGVVFGVPQEIQDKTKEHLQSQNSEELKSYAQLSDDMDKQFSSCYPENAPLEDQLKQTYNTIIEIIQNEAKDIWTINESIGFNEDVDKIIYSGISESFWDQKPKTVLFYFVLIPIILVGIAFYLLSSELALVAFLTICIVDLIAFLGVAKAFSLKKDDLVLSNISQNAEKSNGETSIDYILSINNEITQSDEFKQLIKSIIEDWNFNLDPEQEYEFEEVKCFAYEPNGEIENYNQNSQYQSEINDLKSNCDKELEELNTELNKETDSEKKEQIEKGIENIKNKISELDNLKNLGAKQMYENYVHEEKKFYQKLNAHNKATAEFKTQTKKDKLKSLTQEKINEINKYVNQINWIAKKYKIDDRIEFDSDKLLQWQQKQTEEIPKLIEDQEKINTEQQYVD